MPNISLTVYIKKGTYILNSQISNFFTKRKILNFPLKKELDQPEPKRFKTKTFKVHTICNKKKDVNLNEIQCKKSGPTTSHLGKIGLSDRIQDSIWTTI